MGNIIIFFISYKTDFEEAPTHLLTNTINKVQMHLPFADKKICLTFDDGHKYADKILEKLNLYGQKATFFLCGSYIANNLSMYKKLFESGHEIGNHSYTHPHMTTLSNYEIVAELSQTQKLIDEITENNASSLFRFPYYDRNDSLTQFIKEQGYIPVAWTIDSRDWTGINAIDIYNNIFNSKYLKNGAIILMHTSGAHTAEALDLIIPELIKRNYTMLTVSELLHCRNNKTH